MNGSRQECSTVWTVRCGYGAVVDGQGGPRVAGSSGLDAVGRKTRLTPTADQLNRGDAPILLTLASTERRLRRQGREWSRRTGGGTVLFAKVSQRQRANLSDPGSFFNNHARRLRVTRGSGCALGAV